LCLVVWPSAGKLHLSEVESVTTKRSKKVERLARHNHSAVMELQNV
jgi:hypothetical protein